MLITLPFLPLCLRLCVPCLFSQFQVSHLLLSKHHPQAPFPVDVLTQPWRNSHVQLSFLRLLVIPEHAQYPELVSLLSLFTSRVNREGLKSLSSSADPTLQPWTCLDLVKALLRLGDSNHLEEVRRLFEHPCKVFPEILMIALAQTSLSKPSLMQDQYLSYLMVIFLSPHPNTSVVLSKVWQLRQPLVLKGMVDWYNAEPEPTRLARVLDVAQDIKALPTLLNFNDTNFVLRLAMLAARREFLNLERWLQDRVREHQVVFCNVLISFLQQHLEQHPSGAAGGGLNISPEHIRIMLDVLQNAVPMYAPDLNGAVLRLRELSMHNHQTQMQPTASLPMAPMPLSSGVNVPSAEAFHQSGGFGSQVVMESNIAAPGVGVGSGSALGSVGPGSVVGGGMREKTRDTKTKAEG